jgi:hypothetical protein
MTTDAQSDNPFTSIRGVLFNCYQSIAWLHLGANSQLCKVAAGCAPAHVNADLKLIHFLLNCRFKIDTPPLRSHIAYAFDAVSRLLFTIPAAR